jgi:asparagine synthase (glutamine-hydrolysing)
MSGVAAVILRSRPASGADADGVGRMLDALGSRGAQRDVRTVGHVVLGTVYSAWEQGLAGSAAGDIHLDEDIAVAADATLYYRDDLTRSLRIGAASSGGTAGVRALIAAAYRTHGVRLGSAFEGDHAILVHDRRADLTVGCRDFAGRRPLFYANLADRILVASSVGALLGHPDCPGALDPASIAAAAAGLFGEPAATAYRAISALPPGHTLVVEHGRLRVVRHWSAPPIERRATVQGITLEDGAAELRHLLTRATAERCDPAGTAVWMSGGWDSTTVFGAARTHAGRFPGPVPVSISYPPGDPGREDEYIRMVADHHGERVHWLDIADMPLFERFSERAVARDEPFGHIYESWNRALARGARGTGARVALDGVGGDQLFQVSFVVLAELLRRGRLLAMRREWRAKGLRTRGDAWRWTVSPLLPASARRFAARLLGEATARHYLQRPIPPWMDRPALDRLGVLEREAEGTPPEVRMRPAASEMRWYLEHPFGGRILSTVSSLALDGGIELRSPLLDERIVRFAASRPWSERSWRTETKRLLRAAATDWLPSEVLAPRRTRTGTTSGYLARSLLAEAHRIDEILHGESALADAGMLDADILLREWQRYRRHGGENLAVALLFTTQTELWLRARGGI